MGVVTSEEAGWAGGRYVSLLLVKLEEGRDG